MSCMHVFSHMVQPGDVNGAGASRANSHASSDVFIGVVARACVYSCSCSRTAQRTAQHIFKRHALVLTHTYTQQCTIRVPADTSTDLERDLPVVAWLHRPW